MKRKENRSSYGILLFICICALSIFFPVSAKAENTVTFDLAYGFQNNIKSGSCFPLQVLMDNTGEAFDGTLEITIPIAGDYMGFANSIWMGVSEWGNNKARIYRYEKEITLQKGEKKREILYLELPAFDGYIEVKLKDGEEVLCEKELSCNFSENNSRILVGIVSEDTTGMEEMDGMQIEADSGYGLESFVKTIPLKTEDIYPNPDALSQLDVLIVDEGSEFSENQEVALKRWKENGGFYLKRHGENLYELFQDFLNGEESDGFMAHLDRMRSYSFGDDGGVSQVPVRKKPSMGKYLIILSIYALVAGPGLYILLLKREKRRYLWSCMCVLSVFFMGIIWIMGKKTNLYAPIISYNGLYEQQDDIWSETLHIGIQAPYNSAYHLYLDNEYHLLPVNLESDSMKEYQTGTSESVVIQMGEKSNRITMDHMASFTQNCFKLEKNRKTDEMQLKMELHGENDEVYGTWKNTTAYDICNAVLVMPDRAAIIGDLKAGETGTITDSKLYACGNGGFEVLVKEKMDFEAYQYPEYEITNLASQVWAALRERDPAQSYLLGIVQNPDLNFEGESGYKIYGSALFQMKVDVDWNSDDYIWCPNMEAYGVSRNVEFSEDTNLLNGKEATVDYRVENLGIPESITFFQADYDNEKYYFPFEGKVTLYCWETDTFEEIPNWKNTLQGNNLKRYLSDDGTVRVRYLLDDTIDTKNRSCMLPCISAVGKVV